MHFEMAYQARVACDRIRFAIKHLEQFARGSEPAREVSLQLLDSLDRLEELDRQFQTKSRMGVLSRSERSGGRIMNGFSAGLVGGFILNIFLERTAPEPGPANLTSPGIRQLVPVTGWSAQVSGPRAAENITQPFKAYEFREPIPRLDQWGRTICLHSGQ
jgi:hypothetical protein